MIKLLKKDNILLYKTSKFIKQRYEIENLKNIYFNNFEKVKRDVLKIKRNYNF